jgi:hypothetical protein
MKEIQKVMAVLEYLHCMMVTLLRLGHTVDYGQMVRCCAFGSVVV